MEKLMSFKKYKILPATVFFIALTLWVFPLSAYYVTRGITIKTKTSTGAVKTIRLYSGYHALVVGCANYSKGWPRLPNPVKDAKAVAAMLKNSGWKVKLLKDPDGRALKRGLRKLITGPGRKKDNAILVWFSGHGQTIKEADGTKLGYLVPVDAPDPDKDMDGFLEKAVSMRQVETISKQIMSKHVLMAFDSCFSGAIFQMVRAKPSAYIEEKVAWPVREFITAGTEDEQVPDRSVFKDVFIQSIKDGFADLNKDGYITGQELGSYLQEQVINYSHKGQHPQFGKINNPKLDKGDFVFLASSSAVIEAPSHGKAKAYLSVESNVSDADVFVDGRRVGTTPMADVPVSAGAHRILVKKSGYDTYQKSVRFKKGRSMSLYVDLSTKAPEKAKLYVETQPGDATIKILNTGPVFYQGIELESGRYHVEISADGYETKKLWVTLSEGEDKTLNIRLKPVAVSRQGQKITNSLGMEFVYIKPGTFMMGSPSDESGRYNDEKQHRVILTKGFYMQTTEVTQGQWKTVMGNNPSYFKNCGDNCPVEKVSWNDIQEFISKLNQQEGGNKYRLPTEAQWEYAARAGSDTAFANGGISELKCGYDANLDVMGWYCGNSGVSYSGCCDVSKWGGPRCAGTHPVAQKQPNAWGLYDMHGNAYEWCQDWKGDYPSGSVTDPTGPSSGSSRVLRGGSWGNFARRCRSGFRSGGRPGFRSNFGGFRLVLLPGQ